MGKFRKGICTVLVATDVAARGLDIKDLEVDPTKPELYTGLLNTGHTFGDDLTEEQRLAVLEFLKCL